MGENSLRFPKKEKLHHRSLVEGLFRNGRSFYDFPFRVIWRRWNKEELEKNFKNKVPEDVGKLQMMVSVPKKKRRKAVDRVLMRRRIRESYRLNRNDLRARIESDTHIGSISIALVYIYDKNMPYFQLEEKMKNLLDKLEKIF